MNTPAAILERLTRLHPKAIDLSLGRVERLLGRLGDPQNRLPPVIHVAGTNGKGSVVAYLRAMLEAAGRRVHVYTSPHLVRFNERIRLAGSIIDDEPLIALLDECERANRDDPITFFEITTAAAFLAFARAPAEAVILETGLGGRLDATNTVQRPVATALTPISLDHQSFLGDTLAAIAGEKAGILKPGTPCVVADQERAARKVIAERAAMVGAPLFHEGADWHVQKIGERMQFRSAQRRRDLPLPRLTGAHQMRNAGLAVAALDHAPELAVPETAIALGLATVEWPARLQQLRRGPLLAELPEPWELWLDGGHNPSAGKALAAQARVWRDQPLGLVVGMLDTKDAAAFLKPLVGRAEQVTAVAIPGEAHSRTAEALAEIARAVGHPTMAAPDVAGAVAHLRGALSRPGRILICGSLYLAGQVLTENG